MTKAISSYPDYQRQRVISRRLNDPKMQKKENRGLGYWSAAEAAYKTKPKVKEPKSDVKKDN